MAQNQDHVDALAEKLAEELMAIEPDPASGQTPRLRGKFALVPELRKQCFDALVLFQNSTDDVVAEKKINEALRDLYAFQASWIRRALRNFDERLAELTRQTPQLPHELNRRAAKSLAPLLDFLERNRGPFDIEEGAKLYNDIVDRFDEVETEWKRRQAKPEKVAQSQPRQPTKAELEAQAELARQELEAKRSRRGALLARLHPQLATS